MTQRRSGWQRPGAPARAAAQLASATFAAFGLMCTSAVLAVVVAGALQWSSLPLWLDNTAPVIVLGLGLFFAGRITTDVAPGRGTHAALGAGALVVVIGLSLSWATEAHGDGVEAQHAVWAGVVAAAVGAAGARWAEHRRARHDRGAG